MGYDRRLLPRTPSYPSPLRSATGSDDIIEMGPWESITPQSFEPLPNTSCSTDGLLEDVHGHLRLSTSPQLTDANFKPSDRWEGWQLGARVCFVVVASVLILNVTVTVWASVTFGLKGGIGTIHTGTCPSIKRAGLWLHIAINVLSTVLLGASNYCMQCLSSPTRKELDKAHAEKTWLDVGIQSMRNLTKIRRIRMILWVLLAASSIPLHLMFNSAIFVSLTANEYTVAAVTEDFVNGKDQTLAGPGPLNGSIVSQMQRNISNYEKLDIPDCIKEYGIDYVSARKHVAVVVDGELPNPLVGILRWSYGTSQNSWVCGTTMGKNMTLETISILDYDCSISVALEEKETWYMGDQLVQYCLSERVPDRCRLQFAVPIMVIVLCCNFLKLVCIAVTIWGCRETTLVTMGDAVDSFLSHPDLSTLGLCITRKKDFDGGVWPRTEPRRWADRRSFRYEAVGLRRWIFSNLICTVPIIALSILLRFAIHNTTTASDLATLYSLGFGTVTASSLIRWSHPMVGSSGLMRNVLLANSPQVILSLLYITLNRMYTFMSFSKEWNDFAHYRRPLRVTSPRGAQRSTYFLSLPYRYLIPILTVSITTHWILSQSFFLVAIDVFDEQGILNTTDSILTCGFSCIALIFLISIGWLVLLFGIGMGLRRYKGGMPLAGSCSAAISAACHPLPEEADAAYVAVKWGVTKIEKGIGHCALSGKYVSPPITGRLYLGKVHKDG